MKKYIKAVPGKGIVCSQAITAGKKAKDFSDSALKKVADFVFNDYVNTYGEEDAVSGSTFSALCSAVDGELYNRYPDYRKMSDKEKDKLVDRAKKFLQEKRKQVLAEQQQ